MQLIENIKQYSDDIVSFLGGDVLTTIFIYTYMNQLDWLHPLIKIVLALFVGIMGGIGGLLGKDLYIWLKNKINGVY